MAFVDHVRGVKQVAGIYVVRILGIPTVFSHVGIPAQWASGGKISIGGASYDWSTSLILEESIGSTSSRLLPKAGEVDNGGMSLTFASAGTHRDPAGDVWLDLLCNNPRRSDRDRAQIIENLSWNESGISVVSNPWASPGSTIPLYIGRETITTNTGSATSITATRGAFGSWGQQHQGESYDPGTAAQAIGLTVGDYPLDLTGRVVHVYFCPGEWTSGGLRLHGASLDSAENRIIFAGPITDIDEGDGVKHTIQCVSLDTLLDREVCDRFPRATPFSAEIQPRSRGLSRVYVGSHNKYLHAIVSFDEAIRGPRITVVDYTGIANNDTLTIDGITFTFKTIVADQTTEILIAGSNAAQAGEILKTLKYYIFANSGDWEATRWIGPHVFLGLVNAVDPASLTLAVSVSTPGAVELSGATFAAAGGLGQVELFNLDVTTVSGIALHDWIYPERIGAALNELVGGAFAGVLLLQFAVVEDRDELAADAQGKYMVTMASNPEAILAEFGGLTVTLLPHVGNVESIIKELGFTEPAQGALREGERFAQLKATKYPAQFRWPGPSFPAPSRVFFKDFPSQAVQTDFVNTGTRQWFDDDGVKVPVVIKLGKHEVIAATTSAEDAGNRRYFSSITRGFGNSLPDEELYVEAKGDGKEPPEALRLPAFPNCSVERMFLYLLQGGRGSADTYDAGWDGCGLGLPTALIDVPSFERYFGTDVRDNWCVHPGDKISDIVADECLLIQRFLTTSNGRLTMIDLLPISELDQIDSAFSLGPEQIDSTDIGFDRKTSRIANTVEAQLNYNNATGRFETEATGQQTDSVANYGAKRPVPLSVRGVADVRGSADILGAVVGDLFGQHATPNALIDVDVCSFDCWASDVGDPVLLTLGSIPSPDRAGRGVVDLPCRISAMAHNWLPSDGQPHTRLTLSTDAYRARRSSIWAPTALLLATSDGGTTWTVDDDAFGQFDTELNISYFRVGMKVYVCQRDGLTLAGAVIREITAITESGTPDASTVAFDSPYAGDIADVLIWFVDYDNADVTARQQAHVYLSDAAGSLVDDAAYKYV